jgi:predicted phosphoadenosine phosphosulfate sulfurtransferase
MEPQQQQQTLLWPTLIWLKQSTLLSSLLEESQDLWSVSISTTAKLWQEKGLQITRRLRPPSIHLRNDKIEQQQRGNLGDPKIPAWQRKCTIFIISA